MNGEKPAPEGMITIDSTDETKIREVLNTAVAHMTKAIENIEKHDAVDVLKRMDNPVWDAEMDRHLRHFRHSKAVVEYATWMLGQSLQGRSTEAATTLSRKLNLITAAMAAAVAVQAIAAVVLAYRG